MKDLKQKVFPTRPLSFLAVTDGRREVRTMTMPENPIPNFGVKPPHCFYGADDHVRVAEALRREFPDIYNWMKLYPDGVSPEDSDEAKENFDRLYAFIRSQLPESQFGDRNQVTQLMFIAATYPPEMIQNKIQSVRSRHQK